MAICDFVVAYLFAGYLRCCVGLDCVAGCLFYGLLWFGFGCVGCLLWWLVLVGLVSLVVLLGFLAYCVLWLV